MTQGVLSFHGALLSMIEPFFFTFVPFVPFVHFVRFVRSAFDWSEMRRE